MIAGDEFYPDDVTSGPATDEPEGCIEAIEASYENGRWVIDRCGKPATLGDFCAEHAG